jgi:hypothetical protein
MNLTWASRLSKLKILTFTRPSSLRPEYYGNSKVYKIVPSRWYGVPSTLIHIDGKVVGEIAVQQPASTSCGEHIKGEWDFSFDEGRIVIVSHSTHGAGAWLRSGSEMGPAMIEVSPHSFSSLFC